MLKAVPILYADLSFEDEPDLNSCAYCERSFADKYIRMRHEITCPYQDVKKKHDSQLTVLSNQHHKLQSMVEQLKRENECLVITNTKLKHNVQRLRQREQKLKRELDEAIIEKRVLIALRKPINKLPSTDRSSTDCFHSAPFTRAQTTGTDSVTAHVADYQYQSQSHSQSHPRGGDQYGRKCQNKLRIFDLTVESLSKEAISSYTPGLFLKGQAGVAEFILQFLRPNEQGKYVYICTSRSKGAVNFRYMDKNGIVQQDKEGRMLTGLVWNGIHHTVRKIYRQLCNVSDEVDHSIDRKKKHMDRASYRSEQNGARRMGSANGDHVESDMVGNASGYYSEVATDSESEGSEVQSSDRDDQDLSLVYTDNFNSYSNELKALLRDWRRPQDDMVEALVAVMTELRQLNPSSETPNNRAFINRIASSEVVFV